MAAKGTASGQKVNDGATALVTLSGTVSKGGVYEGTGAIGIYLEDGVSGDTVAIALQGEYTLTKETGVVFAVGDLLFWDATNNRLDKTATNLYAGIATEAAGTNDVLADVALNIGSTLLA